MTDLNRRVFLRGSVTASAVGVAVVAGLLKPQAVFAAWPAEAFKAPDQAGVLKALLGSDTVEQSADVEVTAPEIAENGAVVPITIETKLPGVESISLLVTTNAVPLVASYTMGQGAVPYVSNRIKMGKTGDVVAVIKAGGKLLSAAKTVKVTIGGCGG